MEGVSNKYGCLNIFVYQHQVAKYSILGHRQQQNYNHRYYADETNFGTNWGSKIYHQAYPLRLKHLNK